MIAIKLNDDNFEYDIYSLVKAFYPKEDIIFTRERTKDNVSYFIVINYIEAKIECKLYRPSGDDAKDTQDSEITEEKVSKTTASEDDDLQLVIEDSIKVDHSDRKETKNRLKRLLYNCINKVSGKELYWGTLNGIRPIKIPLNMLEEGMSEDDIRKYMKNTYLACDEKINLSIDIAKRERELIKDIDAESDYSIYIGIPFCPTRCLYCSFTSYPYNIWEKRIEEYLASLKREMEFIASALQDKNLTTIYIGGGTPTSLREDYLEKLLSIIEDTLPVKNLREYNIEAGRPDSITRGKLQIIKEHGISRISVNPQSMNAKTLELIGRRHTPEDVIKSFKLAREIGFDNINMDIIVGLPGEDIDDLTYTLDTIAKLKPDSLTVHSLAIKRSARLNTEKELYGDYKLQNSKEHMDKATSFANALDMKPYYLYRQKNMAGNLENIGFSTSGKEGLYNVLIMEEKQTIIALGAGAYSKYVTDNGKSVTRSENVKDPGLYIDRLDEMIDRKRKKLEEIGWLKD
ncbi:MAG: coproporphyrinogen dehydrogenase HemZ [Lachnospiraceae bacterium]|nr:coproporphyrinogen dehydrogenase HemZ [Lachnospiraceae bacterium]